MFKSVKKTPHRAGLPPGTIVHVGKKKAEKAKISLIGYSEKEFTEKTMEKAGDCAGFGQKKGVVWINVDGLHDTALIESLGKFYGLHPLTLEDIVNTEQRPKIEDTGEYIFLIVKMMKYSEKSKRIEYEQVSIALGKNFVLSFQECEGDIFDRVRERIRGGKGRIRKNNADYLAYSLLDAVVDNYFTILERLGEKVEKIEEELVERPKPETLQKIYRLKREMIFLRKSVWPLREVASQLDRGESKLIRQKTHVYLRDLYDNTIQVIDTVETFRDMVSGMIDLYLSSISNKMNSVMQVLTIIATIFIPLTFIAGLYGMNFEYMPELGWKYGYFAVLGLMLGVGIVMVIYFKKKNWL